MLVQDNARLRESLADALEAEGYEVDRCADTQEARVLLEFGHRPELIIVDEAGSHDAGWLARLRGDARLPLVTLTSDGPTPGEQDSELEVSLAKPVSPDRLLATVSRLLAAAAEDFVSARAFESQRLRSLGTLSAGLANELNNPIAFVIGSLEMARQKCHELGQRVEHQELSVLQDIERLIQHGLRGANRVAEVVRNSSFGLAGAAMGDGTSGPHRDEGGKTGAIDMKSERISTVEGAGFGPASFGRDTRVRPAAESEATPDRDQGTRRARILVIDDEQLMCELLGAMLSDDHEVVALSNAQEALARITSGDSFDLILCDLMMPGLTGMDLYAELARVRPEQASRMVFMTGGTFTDRAQEFLAEHGRVQLQKPFRHDELLSLVDGRLEELKRSAQSSLH